MKNLSVIYIRPRVDLGILLLFLLFGGDGGVVVVRKRERERRNCLSIYIPRN